MGMNRLRDQSRSIRDIWTEYRKTEAKATELRNQLIEHYLHLVRYQAERIHVKLPAEIELDDLISAGVFGLINAIDAFDPERGVMFETYCAPRIRGAIWTNFGQWIGFPLNADTRKNACGCKEPAPNRTWPRSDS